MKLRSALVLSFLAAVTSALFVTGALAHSRPIRFDPAPGAVLSTSPARVDAWFTSDLRRDPNWTFLRVTDQSGARVDAGETSLSSDRRQLSVQLKAGLPAGRYVVTWRNWDDGDGEILGDCYTFFVGQAAADAAVNDKTRLDAGSACERAEFPTTSGTPTAAQVTTFNSTPHAETEAHSGEDSSGGLPAWTLVLGVIAGVVLGGLGARFVGQRP